MGSQERPIAFLIPRCVGPCLFVPYTLYGLSYTDLSRYSQIGQALFSYLIDNQNHIRSTVHAAGGVRHQHGVPGRRSVVVFQRPGMRCSAIVAGVRHLVTVIAYLLYSSISRSRPFTKWKMMG